MAKTTIDNIVVNDKLYDLNFTLKNYDGTAFDLTGATIKLNVQTTAGTALKFAGAMTIVSALAGTCKYSVAAGNFDAVGNYYAEIEVTKPDTSIVTFPDIIIKVISKIPK